MNIEHLEGDELLIEFEIRGIKGPLLRQLTLLGNILKNENEGTAEIPDKPHLKASQHPKREIDTCINKLKTIRECIQTFLNSENQGNELLEGITSRIIHLQGRINRISKSKGVKTVSEKINLSCQTLLETIVKVQQQQISKEDSLATIDTVPVEYINPEDNLSTKNDTAEDTGRAKSPPTPIVSQGQLNTTSSLNATTPTFSASFGTNNNRDLIFHRNSHLKPTSGGAQVNNIPGSSNQPFMNNYPQYPSRHMPPMPFYFDPTMGSQFFSTQMPPMIQPLPFGPNMFIRPPGIETLGGQHHSNHNQTRQTETNVNQVPNSAQNPNGAQNQNTTENQISGSRQNSRPTTTRFQTPLIPEHNFSSTRAIDEHQTTDPLERIVELSQFLNEYLSQTRAEIMNNNISQNVSPIEPEIQPVPAPSENQNTFTIENRNVPAVSSSTSNQKSRNGNSTSSIILKWNISFDGSSKDIAVERFLFRVQYLASSFEITEEQLVKNLGFLLKGPAKEFYWVLVEKAQNLTWQQLRCAFINQYKDRRTDSDIRHILDLRKQRFKENIQDFYNDLLAISLPLRTPLTDLETLDLMKRNMRAGLQISIAGEQFRSLPDFLHRCISIEDSWNRIGFIPEQSMFPRNKINEIDTTVSQSQLNLTPQSQSQINYSSPPHSYQLTPSNTSTPQSISALNTDHSNLSSTQILSQNINYQPLGNYSQNTASTANPHTYTAHPFTAQIFQSHPPDHSNFMQSSGHGICLPQPGVSSNNPEFHENSTNHQSNYAGPAIDAFTPCYTNQSNFSHPSIMQIQKYTPPKACFNCLVAGHNWVECPAAFRKMFCYTCGWMDTVKPKCPYCNYNKPGNVKKEVRNPAETHLPISHPQSNQTQHTSFQHQS